MLGVSGVGSGVGRNDKEGGKGRQKNEGEGGGVVPGDNLYLLWPPSLLPPPSHEALLSPFADAIALTLFTPLPPILFIPRPHKDIRDPVLHRPSS